MFGRAIWNKLHDCIFENLEIAQVKPGQFHYFQKSRGSFISKIARIKRDYWLIKPNQLTLCTETNIF